MSGICQTYGLEVKFCRPEEALRIGKDNRIEGYASLFDRGDQGGDVVAPGAYAKSLGALKATGRRIKMLWQHDPALPIGVWDEAREDARGLYVGGRILTEVGKGREAAALVEAGVIDGLSIGYRTRTAVRDGRGRRRLTELELWEVSLVTFPMLPDARIGAKGDAPDDALPGDLARLIRDARQGLTR